MKEIIESLPKQILDGSKVPPSLKAPKRKYHSVLICGMGGSGISGEILKVLYPEIPIITNHDYVIPTYVNRNTLVVLISYSGNTEETLANYQQAKKRGATLAIISSNGQLLKKQASCKVTVPGGYPPRGALGYLFSPLPMLLFRFNIIPDDPTLPMRRLASALQRAQPVIKKYARRISEKIYNKLPLLYVNSPLLWPVAYRWQCQLNENAKMLAHINTIPEMNHNEIVGLGEPAQVRKHSQLLLLHDPKAHPRNRIRMKILKEITQRQYGTPIEIHARGRTNISRLFWMISLGDFVSYYCAVKKGVDPMPVKRIDLLKKRLARIKRK